MSSLDKGLLETGDIIPAPKASYVKDINDELSIWLAQSTLIPQLLNPYRHTN
jgi:hypothetical protein